MNSCYMSRDIEHSFKKLYFMNFPVVIISKARIGPPESWTSLDLRLGSMPLDPQPLHVLAAPPKTNSLAECL